MARDKDPKGLYVVLMNNYPNFIYNASALKDPPKSYNDLLDPKFSKKIQYSTPGQAGDGTEARIAARIHTSINKIAVHHVKLDGRFVQRLTHGQRASTVLTDVAGERTARAAVPITAA